MVRRLPQRTCVACRQVKSKRELVRLVCASDGSIEVDTSGQKAGRGAYLCAVSKCWRIGLEGGRLERALRTTLTGENRKRLIEAAKELALPAPVQGVN